MRPFTLLALISTWFTTASLCGAQQDRRVTLRSVIGCWSVTPGHFSIVEKDGADPGQTLLPSVLEFDTVPGKSWMGAPLGRRVRAVVANNGTRYRDGYYLLAGADSLRVDWTNSVVGMTLDVRLGGSVMRGRATAWTDYMGEERASVVLRRVPCRREGFRPERSSARP